MSILTYTFGNDTRMISLAHLAVLEVEVEILKSKIQPHDTGHIYTTISVLNERIAEIKSTLDKLNERIAEIKSVIDEYDNEESHGSSVGRASV